MEYSDKQLIEKFIETIPVKPVKTKRLFGIGFVGLVGSGKSYVAQIISQKLDLYIASNDKISTSPCMIHIAKRLPSWNSTTKEKTAKKLFSLSITSLTDGGFGISIMLTKNIPPILMLTA